MLTSDRLGDIHMTTQLAAAPHFVSLPDRNNDGNGARSAGNMYNGVYDFGTP